MQLILSVIFQVWMYGLMLVLGILGAPLALWSRAGAYKVMHLYVRMVFGPLRWLCGLKTEVRGTPPSGEVLIAAKHQSFLDILLLFHALPAAKFVMKRSIVWTPVIGFYALRIGASPVTRGKGRESINEMIRGVEARRAMSGQLIIYPQGTRVAPRAMKPYKKGAHLIYETYQMECVPVAVNTGHFWPRIGLRRYPGVAVVEFLPSIPAGLSLGEFMNRLEREIEPASDALAEEAAQKYGR